MQIMWQCATKVFKDNWIKTLTNSCNMQISDSTIPGLYLRYYAKTGQISFYLAYRNSITRKQRHMLIGRYSDFKLSEIKDRAQEMRKIIATGEDPIEIREQKRKAQQREQETRLTVKQVFGEYVEKYSRVYKKPSTQRSDIQEFNAYIANRLGDRYIKELEEKDMIEAYTAWVQATSFSTANKTLSLFSSMWDWCETFKYVPRGSNPCRYIKKGSNEKFKAVVLDLAGYKKLFNALDMGLDRPDMTPRMFRALKILALTGCRCSEITDLERTEVALDEKMLHLKDSKTGARDVKLSDAAVEELRLALAESANMDSIYVFPGVHDRAKPISNVTKPFNWALRQAGLPHMRIHDLRHSFITMGANMGENMNAMRDAAGHSKITTTEMYTHIADKSTFQAVNHIAQVICA